MNGTKTSYVWDGSALLGQQGGGKTLIFLYDATGLYGFRYNGSTYFYLYNGQGDVVGILNNTGARVVSYTYDAWGNPLTTTGSLASTIGELNPIRYRGYYYDAESGLYYLQSRYYDPVVGRFINADGIVAIMGVVLTPNMFAYCLNNPVNKMDHHGLSSEVGTAIPWDEAVKEALAAIGGAIAGAGAGISALGGLILSMPLWLTGDSAQSFPKAKETKKTEAELLLDEIKTISKAVTLVQLASKKMHGHHIVAKAAPAAQYARSRLTTVYDINDPINIMPLEASYHQSMHTNAYYTFVNNVFEARTGYWDYTPTTFVQKRKDVRKALTDIKGEIILHSFSFSDIW